MTLVLPASTFIGDQLPNSPLFAASGSTRNPSMPCVFDGEALDFESALMTDWSSDINDYDAPNQDSIKSPSGLVEKRKAPSNVNAENKKARVEDTSSSNNVVTSSSSSPLTASRSSLPPSPLATTHPTRECCSSPLATDGQEEEVSSTIDDEEFLPRRRVPQMWNSRQRWKDERKKVLKMSINKLAEIEDPELWLLRSVLINNTIKKLHLDIRNERQAKLRHRQQRMDYFAERFQSLLPLTSNHFPSENADFNNPIYDNRKSTSDANNSDLYDDTSCDEIFGISEDFLRVNIPDRRVSSPIPTNPQPGCSLDDTAMDTSEAESNSSNDEPMDSVSTSTTTTPVLKSCVTASCYSSSSPCDTDASPFYRPRTTVHHNSGSESSDCPTPSSNRRHLGGQCATQFRTNRDCSTGDGTFPPRVPILDSVVYHSLLASLESS